MDALVGTQDRAATPAIGSIERRRLGARTAVAPAAVAAGVAIAVIAAVALPQRGETLSAAAADPLTSRSVIEYRAQERGSATTVGDPLVAPSAVQFRAEERGSAASADPLLSRSLVEFRAEERGSESAD